MTVVDERQRADRDDYPAGPDDLNKPVQVRSKAHIVGCGGSNALARTPDLGDKRATGRSRRLKSTLTTFRGSQQPTRSRVCSMREHRRTVDFKLETYQSPQQAQRTVFNMRCPVCRHDSTLRTMAGGDYLGGLKDGGQVWFGARSCGNPDCGALIFIVYASTSDKCVLVSYPAERVDFDSSDLPEPVLRAFEEAISAHANGCYMSAAIMVRKTFEEVCADQGATGPNLYKRIEALGKKLTLKSDMLTAVHDLRLLGNDAAHVELSDFDDVGEEEVTVAIDVAKEILKSTYQMQSIMGRLGALKADPT